MGTIKYNINMKFLTIAALTGAVAAYKADDKVAIDLYYESYCPYCRDQIVGNFKKAYETEGFFDMATVTLHPYGNAHESANSNGEWSFSCQHGPTECQYNVLEACALNNLQTTQGAFPFIECVEASLPSADYDGVATKCAKQVGVTSVDKILTCFKGVQGNALEHKVALATEALSPPHGYVPWLVADGVHTDDIQNAAGDNLLGYVCKNYKGVNKAKACDQAFELSTKDMEVCYQNDNQGVFIQ